MNILKYDAAIEGWKDLMTGKTNVMTVFRLRDDDRFSSDDNPYRAVSFITAEGRQCLITVPLRMRDFPMPCF